MITLRPYQIECLSSIRDFFERGTCRQLVSLPTGSGKTVIFSTLIKETDLKTLIIAHTNELLEQARDKIKMISPDLEVGIINSQRKEFGRQVTISSIQSARIPQNLERLKSENFDLLIYDESHHAAADSPREVLQTLGFGKGTRKLLAGFTATAFRQDGRGLAEIFDQIVFERSIGDMIQDGYLSNPVGIKIATDLDLSKIKSCEGDFQIKGLSDLMDIPEMVDIVTESYKEKGENRRAICFGVTVQHALNLARSFKQKGISSETVYGAMPRCERDGILSDFRSGNIQVLTNCQVLTEGFDCPETECVIIARPTKSPGLYQQMAGRGLRIYPNKRDCIILDCSDKNHSLCTSAILLKDAEIAKQKDELEQARKKEILEKIPLNLNQKLKTALISFDPLGQEFTWQKDESGYFMKGSGEYRLEVIHQGDDQYRTVLSSLGGVKVLSQGLTFDYAFATAESFARTNQNLFVISDRGASWREDPISEKQLKYLRGCGFRAGVENLLKGQAADLITSGILRKTG